MTNTVRDKQTNGTNKKAQKQIPMAHGHITRATWKIGEEWSIQREKKIIYLKNKSGSLQHAQKTNPNAI